MSEETRLCLLDRPTELDGEERWGFSALPFALLEEEATERPDEKQIQLRWQSYPADYLNLLRGIDWLLTQRIDVIILSVGPRTTTFDPQDPLQIATRCAHDCGISVVVAAGNYGPELDTLRGLARAPWVISVGAADGEGKLMKSSSRGCPNGPQPTVVADGRPRRDHLQSPPDEPAEWSDYSAGGTSFAAPKVASLTVWITKSLDLLMHDFADQVSDSWGIQSKLIRMPIVGIADTGCDPRFLPPMNDLARGIWSTGDSVACSHADRERGWYAGLSSALTKLGFNGEMRLTPDVVKRAVQVMARPMEGCESWEAGAGELGPDEIRDYLCDLTPSKVLDIFCPDLVRNALPETLRSIDASQGGLWPREKVDALAQLFLGGIRCATVKVL